MGWEWRAFISPQATAAGLSECYDTALLVVHQQCDAELVGGCESRVDVYLLVDDVSQGWKYREGGMLERKVRSTTDTRGAEKWKKHYFPFGSPGADSRRVRVSKSRQRLRARGCLLEATKVQLESEGSEVKSFVTVCAEGKKEDICEVMERWTGGLVQQGVTLVVRQQPGQGHGASRIAMGFPEFLQTVCVLRSDG